MNATIVFEDFEDLREFAAEERKGLRPNPNYKFPERSYGLVRRGTAAYVPPEIYSESMPKSVRDNLAKAKEAGFPDTPRARAGGVILQTRQPKAKSGLDNIFRDAPTAGYADANQLDRVLKRHELIHSIQASKRGYKAPRKLRELIGDEIGAYRDMDKKLKLPQDGASVAKRRLVKIGGVLHSVHHGVKANPMLKRRLAGYAAGAAGTAALGGGALITKKIMDGKRVDKQKTTSQ